NTNTTTYTTVANNIIFLGADTDGDGVADQGLAANMHTGDRVQYIADTNAPTRWIAGLVSGPYYYANKLNDFQIQLSAPTDGTVAHDEGNGNHVDAMPIELTTDHLSDADVRVRHMLVPQALGGLTEGVTYTVFNRTANSFQLEDSTGALVTGLTLG